MSALEDGGREAPSPPPIFRGGLGGESRTRSSRCLRLPERLLIFALDLGAADADVVQDVVRHLIEMITGAATVGPVADPVEQGHQALADVRRTRLAESAAAAQIAVDLYHDSLTSQWVWPGWPLPLSLTCA